MIESIIYFIVIYYSLIQLAEHNDIYMYAFTVTGCIAGLISITFKTKTK